MIEEQITKELEKQGVLKTEKAEEKQSSDEQIEQRDLSDFEREQKDKGWNPNGVKTAEEWARNEPLYEEIKKRGKEIKSLERAIDNLTKIQTRKEELAYNKALDQLRNERDAAIKLGNVQAVKHIEQQQLKLHESQKQEDPAIQEFRSKYGHLLTSNNYEEMEIADFIKRRDGELMSHKLPPAEHLRLLEEHAMKKFPSYFKQDGDPEERDERLPIVESGQGSNVSKPRSSSKKFTFDDLSPEQKKIGKEFERLKVMKLSEYIKDLADLGDIR